MPAKPRCASGWQLVRRSPKLVSRSLLVVALVTLALAAIFGVRTFKQKQQLRLSVEATAVLRTTEKDIADARFLLNSPLGHKRPEETEQACRRVLDRYAVEQADWRDGNLFRPLHPPIKPIWKRKSANCCSCWRHLRRYPAAAAREEALRLTREAERCLAGAGEPASAQRQAPNCAAAPAGTRRPGVPGSAALARKGGGPDTKALLDVVPARPVPRWPQPGGGRRGPL